jgi:hypothetical protein
MKPLLGPDFFIVGAPKCGTTSLNAYLGEHPEIFMATKELHFFGADLDGLRPAYRGRDATRSTEEEYLAHFAGGERAAIRGETSVWYLFSHHAAREIHDFNPSARIIVSLRNPLDVLASLHSHFLYTGIEDIDDFATALAAEPDRRAGRRIPAKAGEEPWRLFYRDVIRFDEQLDRYFATFGRENVHVVLFDDLQQKPAETYRGVLEFLGVDAEFVPAFRVENANKRIRSRWLAEVIWQAATPTSSIRRIGRRIIPIHRLRSAMLRRGVPALKQANTAVGSRPGLPAELRESLGAELRPGIERLAALLNSDLGRWLATGDVRETALSAAGQR